VVRTFIAPIALAAALLTLASSESPSNILHKAQANPSCVAQCRAAHSQCRVATKNSSSCDAQLQSCLQTCLSRR